MGQGVGSLRNVSCVSNATSEWDRVLGRIRNVSCFSNATSECDRVLGP